MSKQENVGNTKEGAQDKTQQPETQRGQSSISNHLHVQLIEDSQWVSYCVKAKCCFRDNIEGFVCYAHSCRHVCNSSSCSFLKNMLLCNGCDPELLDVTCPVEALSLFHKPEVELRTPFYKHGREDNTDMSYRALKSQPCVSFTYTDACKEHLILKSCLPVLIALFSTMLSKGFAMKYRILDRNNDLSALPRGLRGLCTDKIFQLADAVSSSVTFELPCSADMAPIVKEATLKTAVAIASLFESRERKIERFMKRVACSCDGRPRTQVDFYTNIVMLTLCMFPYLKHRGLSDMCERTLVLMCFDKTRTRHSEWSTLATHIHLHAKQPAFMKRVCRNKDLWNVLPVVVSVTLDKCIEDASYVDRDPSIEHLIEGQGHVTALSSASLSTQAAQREKINQLKKKKKSVTGHPPGIFTICMNPDRRGSQHT